MDRKVYEESQLIIRGASIPLISKGDNGNLKTFLEKVLRGYKWYLGNSSVILYVEQKNSAEIINLLKENGCLREN